jgi:hypothetical protein
MVQPQKIVPEHLINTLSDVPAYMKETYRAALPYYAKKFDIISQKCDYIKQFIQKTKVDLTRFNFGIDNNARLQHPLKLESDQNKINFAEIADAIASGCFVLSGSCTDTLKEIAYDPIYMQTFDGFIERYRSQYSNTPLMPLSLSLFFARKEISTTVVQQYGNRNQDINTVLALYTNAIKARVATNDVTVGNVNNDIAVRLAAIPMNSLNRYPNLKLYNDKILDPDKSIGTPEFKMLYGNSLIIASNTVPKLDKMPSVKDSINRYNSSAPVREQFDAGQYEKFVQNCVSLLRYITDARHFKASCSTAPNLYSITSTVSIDAQLSSPLAVRDETQAYSVISIVESSNQEESVAQLTKNLQTSLGEDQNNSRNIELRNNIMDMNIVPINVNALLRDVPLVNLYNYSYTFDKLVKNMYYDTNGTSTSTFVDLLKEPHKNVNIDDYGLSTNFRGILAPIKRIMTGVSDLNMGRPKFIYDQLFEKTLLCHPGINTPNAYNTGDENAIPVSQGVMATLGLNNPRGRITNERPDERNAIRLRLSYLKDNSFNTKRIVVGQRYLNLANAISKARFDTTLVRNLFFIPNLNRLIRTALDRELRVNRDVIRSNHPAISANVTEFGSDPFTPNEDISSNFRNRDPRYVDQDAL